MVKEYNFVYIGNPTAIFNKLWYIERIHSHIMNFNIRSTSYSNRRNIEMFERLNTIRQRWIEGQLKMEAIKDLYNYIVNANHERKFIISLMKIGRSDNKFGCRFENGSWLLTYRMNSELPVTSLLNEDCKTDEEIRSYSFDLIRLCELANSIYIIGIAFIEAIPQINVVEL
jgi:hypothetical protein